MQEKWLKVDIDWTSYYTESEEEADIRLFTDVENVYTYNDSENPDTSGTKLIIHFHQRSLDQEGN